jgi:hypothetical protein
MKVFQIAAVSLLTLPAVTLASSGPPHHAKPPSPPAVSPGPINGTVIHPRIVGTAINPGTIVGPGPINGTVINPGTIPGPINGTVINPGDAK